MPLWWVRSLKRHAHHPSPFPLHRQKTHATTTSTATEIGAFPSNGVFTQYGATTHHGVTTYGPVPTYAPIIIAQGPYGAQYVVQVRGGSLVNSAL